MKKDIAGEIFGANLHRREFCTITESGYAIYVVMTIGGLNWKTTFRASNCQTFKNGYHTLCYFSSIFGNVPLAASVFILERLGTRRRLVLCWTASVFILERLGTRRRLVLMLYNFDVEPLWVWFTDFVRLKPLTESARFQDNLWNLSRFLLAVPKKCWTCCTDKLISVCFCCCCFLVGFYANGYFE